MLAMYIEKHFEVLEHVYLNLRGRTLVAYQDPNGQEKAVKMDEPVDFPNDDCVDCQRERLATS